MELRMLGTFSLPSQRHTSALTSSCPLAGALERIKWSHCRSEGAKTSPQTHFRINRSSILLSSTSRAFRAHAAPDPSLVWAVDAATNPYSVFQYAASILGMAVAAVLAFRLASAAFEFVLWDYTERRSDDPNRAYDLSVGMERPGPWEQQQPPSQNPAKQGQEAAADAPSDMELLMAEFVRLDVGSEELNAAIFQVLEAGEEGKSGMLAIYDTLVGGMQRQLMVAATSSIAIVLGVQQKLPFTMAADLLNRSLQAPKRHWTGLLASTLVDGNVRAGLSLYGLTHVRRSRELVALCSGQLSTAQAFDATLRMTKCLDGDL